MTTRITAADLRAFKVVSPTKIEIELRNPIEVAFFDLNFDLQISGASTVGLVPGERPGIFTEAPRTSGSVPVEIDFKNLNA